MEPGRIFCSVSGHEERSKRKATKADDIAHEPIENHYFGNKTAVVAYYEFVFEFHMGYVELKNTLGVCGDGGLQTAISLRKYAVQEHVELLVIILDRPGHLPEAIYSIMVYRMSHFVISSECCDRCVIISVAGPYLLIALIAKAIFVEVTFCPKPYGSHLHWWR